MKPSDSIVDEVRAARATLAKESNDDIEKIVEAARNRQVRNGHRVVTLPPRKTQLTKRAS
jgi:hypothetical protein